VTGASTGIGYELGLELARRGYDLVIAAEDPGINAAARDMEQLGAIVTAAQVDLATYDGVEKLYTAAKSPGRPFDVVAINAGVGVGGDFVHTDLEAELKLIDLNVKSAVHLAKRVLQDMAPRRQGRILFTSSIAATAPGPFEAVYAASKAFLFSFSEALRSELKDQGITVTALMPGATETNFFHRAGMDDTKVGQSEKDDPAEVAREGIDALMAGKDRVIAGSLKNTLFATAGRLAPETAAEMHRKQTEPKHT
jgi:short-subunit dehydrogenase